MLPGLAVDEEAIAGLLLAFLGRDLVTEVVPRHRVSRKEPVVTARESLSPVAEFLSKLPVAFPGLVLVTPTDVLWPTR